MIESTASLQRARTTSAPEPYFSSMDEHLASIFEGLRDAIVLRDGRAHDRVDGRDITVVQALERAVAPEVHERYVAPLLLGD